MPATAVRPRRKKRAKKKPGSGFPVAAVVLGLLILAACYAGYAVVRDAGRRQLELDRVAAEQAAADEAAYRAALENAAPPTDAERALADLFVARFEAFADRISGIAIEQDLKVARVEADNAVADLTAAADIVAAERAAQLAAGDLTVAEIRARFTPDRERMTAAVRLDGRELDEALARLGERRIPPETREKLAVTYGDVERLAFTVFDTIDRPLRDAAAGVD